jgi:hypothetical protein
MSQLTPELEQLGVALEQAAAHDLARRRPARRRRRLLLAVAAAIALPGAALGAEQLLNTDDVANSMPAGAGIFGGRHPTCTVVKPNVEYHCVLDRPPVQEGQDFKGTVEETVDSTHHVNGGCRGLTSDGIEWECYIGQEAVRQQIISQGFLGERQDAPGWG